ncbi:MAG: hypothetical protein ACRCSZ_11125, partial [Lactococcus lactis]
MNNPNSILATFTFVRDFRLILVDGQYDLYLTLSEDIDDYSNSEIFQFNDISQLSLPNFGDGAQQFCLLQISKYNNGFDRVNYCVEDVENEKIRFYCA